MDSNTGRGWDGWHCSLSRPTRRAWHEPPTRCCRKERIQQHDGVLSRRLPGRFLAKCASLTGRESIGPLHASHSVADCAALGEWPSAPAYDIRRGRHIRLDLALSATPCPPVARNACPGTANPRPFFRPNCPSPRPRVHTRRPPKPGSLSSPAHALLSCSSPPIPPVYVTRAPPPPSPPSTSRAWMPCARPCPPLPLLQYDGGGRRSLERGPLGARGQQEVGAGGRRECTPGRDAGGVGGGVARRDADLGVISLRPQAPPLLLSPPPMQKRRTRGASFEAPEMEWKGGRTVHCVLDTSRGAPSLARTMSQRGGPPRQSLGVGVGPHLAWEIMFAGGCGTFNTAMRSIVYTG